MEALPEAPGRVVADRGFSTIAFRAEMALAGVEVCVPPRRSERSWPWDRAPYKARSRVERLWARLKEARGVATRYDKSAAAFAAGILLAAALDWIK